MPSILFGNASIFRLSGGGPRRRKKAMTKQPSIRTYFEPSAARVASEDDGEGDGEGDGEDDGEDDDHDDDKDDNDDDDDDDDDRGL
jgi:hypothetical protein